MEDLHKYRFPDNAAPWHYGSGASGFRNSCWNRYHCCFCRCVWRSGGWLINLGLNATRCDLVLRCTARLISGLLVDLTLGKWRTKFDSDWKAWKPETRSQTVQKRNGKDEQLWRYCLSVLILVVPCLSLGITGAVVLVRKWQKRKSIGRENFARSTVDPGKYLHS